MLKNKDENNWRPVFGQFFVIIIYFYWPQKTTFMNQENKIKKYIKTERQKHLKYGLLYLLLIKHPETIHIYK